MKKLLFLVLILGTNFIFGQTFFDRGELFYRDGTSVKGYIKINFSDIQFKQKITDKKSVKLDYNKVNKLIIDEDGEEFEYQYKIIKGRKKGKFKLLKIVIIGDASLYSLAHETTLGNSDFGPFTIGLNYNGFDYFIGEKESSLVEYIGANSVAVGRKGIRKGLIEYFKDCPELVEKLDNKDFKNKDIIEVIHFFNKNCKTP